MSRPPKEDALGLLADEREGLRIGRLLAQVTLPWNILCQDRLQEQGANIRSITQVRSRHVRLPEHLNSLHGVLEVSGEEGLGAAKANSLGVRR